MEYSLNTPLGYEVHHLSRTMKPRDIQEWGIYMCGVVKCLARENGTSVTKVLHLVLKGATVTRKAKSICHLQSQSLTLNQSAANMLGD